MTRRFLGKKCIPNDNVMHLPTASTLPMVTLTKHSSVHVSKYRQIPF